MFGFDELIFQGQSGGEGADDGYIKQNDPFKHLRPGSWGLTLDSSIGKPATAAEG